MLRVAQYRLAEPCGEMPRGATDPVAGCFRSPSPKARCLPCLQSRKVVGPHVHPTCAYCFAAFFMACSEEMAVETVEDKYVRKGKVCSLQLDFDALEMLQELSPTRKSYGRYLSELVRRDYVRRQDWRLLRELQQAALVNVGGLSDE